jgi:hypothetical protein
MFGHCEHCKTNKEVNKHVELERWFCRDCMSLYQSDMDMAFTLYRGENSPAIGEYYFTNNIEAMHYLEHFYNMKIQDIIVNGNSFEHSSGDKSMIFRKKFISRYEFLY